MRLIKTEEAVGHILCHDITQIIKDVTKDARFRKGHIVKEEDIPFLFNQENNLNCLEWWITADARPDRSNEQWLNILCKKS